MKLEDFLIKNEELRNTATEKMLEESYIKEKVREWLNNTYKEKFVSYNFNFRPMVTEAIKKDLKTKKAIHVLNILSSEEEKIISYIYALEEVSTEIKIDNTVIYYPEFKMAVVSFITSYGNVTSYHCLLFSADESLIQGYFDHIKRSYENSRHLTSLKWGFLMYRTEKFRTFNISGVDTLVQRAPNPFILFVHVVHI